MKKEKFGMKLTMQLKQRSYDIILKAGCLKNLHQFTNTANRKAYNTFASIVAADFDMPQGVCADGFRRAGTVRPNRS